MPEFNVADGSVATILKEGSPLALIKGYQANTWFYAPRAARIARADNGRPLFAVVRNRRHAPGGQGFETLGGVFAAQLELAVPIPTQQEVGEWTEYLQSVSGIRPQGTRYFRFQPLRLRQGAMDILGVDAYVDDAARLQDITVGASSTIPVTLELNALGADTFASALRQNDVGTLPLTVGITYQYDLVVPKCHYKITASNRRVYDFFSQSVKARASYWGWVGANYERQDTRESLKSSGAIVIEQISAPNGLSDDRIKKLEEAIIDAWVKNVVAKICEKPQIDRANASKPGGFFGGVSVAIKSYHQVQNMQLSAEFNYSQLSEEPYSLAYTFGPQFAEVNADDYLIDVVDDNKLPIVINLTHDDNVFRYSGQFGYRKQDGTYVANAITDVAGNQGAVLTGQIQFSPNEPMPEETEIQLVVDWTNPDWEDRVEKRLVKNGASGVADRFSPGNNIARIRLVTDLETVPAGGLAILSWKSKLPDYQGNPVKVYSGSLILAGRGDDGQIQTSDVVFPYYEGTQADSELEWEVTISAADGSVYSKTGSAPVTKAAIPFLRSVLMAEAGPTLRGDAVRIALMKRLIEQYEREHE